jgi:hypothetical protein
MVKDSAWFAGSDVALENMEVSAAYCGLGYFHDGIGGISDLRLRV